MSTNDQTFVTNRLSPTSFLMFYSTNNNEARKNCFLLEHTLKPPSGFFVELVGRLVCSDTRRAMLSGV
jgi:hypothetical protein